MSGWNAPGGWLDSKIVQPLSAIKNPLAAGMDDKNRNPMLELLMMSDIQFANGDTAISLGGQQQDSGAQIARMIPQMMAKLGDSGVGGGGSQTQIMKNSAPQTGMASSRFGLGMDDASLGSAVDAYTGGRFSFGDPFRF